MISRRQLLLGMAAAPVVAALPASAEPIGRGMARILEIPCAPLAGGQKYTLSYWAKPEGADRWMKISRVLEAWQGQVAVQIEQASIVSDYCDAQLTRHTGRMKSLTGGQGAGSCEKIQLDSSSLLLSSARRCTTTSKVK